MFAVAITVLFTLTGIIAAAVIADSLLKARAAYARLMREGDVMRAGLALQAAAIDMQLRPSARTLTPRRHQTARRRTLQACAAA